MNPIAEWPYRAGEWFDKADFQQEWPALTPDEVVASMMAHASRRGVEILGWDLSTKPDQAGVIIFVKAPGINPRFWTSLAESLAARAEREHPGVTTFVRFI